MSEARDLLRRYALKRTSCREGIINLMMQAGQALSEHDIRDGLAGTYDRTTFYRSFKTLEESGIIHKIVLDSQKVRYALAGNDAGQSHAHFHCTACQSVRCLSVAPVPPIALPQGYSMSEAEIILHGFCPICNQTTAS